MSFILACLIKSTSNDTSVDVDAVVKNYKLSTGNNDGESEQNYTCSTKLFKIYDCIRCWNDYSYFKCFGTITGLAFR